MKPIVLWHGAQRWQGDPEVRAQRASNVKHGPGVYLTTSVATARKYAKGGGVLLRFEIDPRTRFLQRANNLLPLTDVLRWLDERPRLPRRADIQRRLVYLASITPRPDLINAEFVLNVMANENVAHGAHGVALARFLASHGIDASHAKSTADEDWVVLFNPRVVLKWERVSAGAAVDAPRVVRDLEGLL